ncbi:MAG: hypothetical protein R2856_22155 [Caldilineaceae bacterium]
MTDDAKRAAVAEGWVPALPGELGLTVVEMMHAVTDGKARYVRDGRTYVSDPT